MSSETAALDRPAAAPLGAARWSLGAALLALALSAAMLIWLEDAAAPYAAGAAALAAPGLLGWLALRGGLTARGSLTVLWALAAAAAVGLTGGLSGPYALLAVAPALAAMALGGSPLWGGLLALAAAALGQWANQGVDWPATLRAPAPGLDLRAGVTLGALAWAALASATAPRRRTVRVAPTTPRATAAAEPLLTPAPEALADERTARLEQERDAAQAAQRAAEAALKEAEEGRRAARAVLQVTVDGREAAEQRVREAESARDAAAADRDKAQAELAEVAAALDAAERLRAEAEAGRSQAEDAAAARIRFLANMSHELRTPLNAILGFSEIMTQRLFGPLSEKYTEYAQLIHDSGRHLLDVINDVLDMAKVEAGRFDLHPERFDAREPVEAAVTLMRRQAEEAGVRLRAVLPDAPVEVDADRRALKQITLNLLSNALKFTPPGGEVAVIAGPREHELELSVSDTGVGIALEDLERLGRPFEQAGDSDAKAQGTGLGLSLVRAMAALHGGTMGIESRLGDGAAVTVTLPVLVNTPATAALPRPDGPVAQVIPLAR